MDEYYIKYARPLDKLNIYELKQNLNKWRDNIREELEGLIFIKNSLSSDTFNKIDAKTKSKFNDIIHKLESVSLKEIECISEFSFEIEKKGISEIDDKIYTKIEYIRDNYNKILLNIQKMISSSTSLMEIRQNFESNKNSLAGFNFPNNFKNNSTFNSVAEKEGQTYCKKSNEEGKEWIDKLEKDLDTLKKDQNLISTKIEKKKILDSSFRQKESNKTKEYSVTKELDNLTIKNSQHQKLKEESIRSKKSSQKFPKPLTNIRHSTPPQRNSNSLNTVTTTSRLQTPLVSQNPKSVYNYEVIKNLIEEMEHIKEFCKDLKRSQEENCIMQNERNIFDKIKNEHIKLNADTNIIKEDIKEILGNYHNLMKRVAMLEDENKNLRAHNKNLVRFVQNTNNRNEGNINPTYDNRTENNFDCNEGKCKKDFKNYNSNPTQKYSSNIPMSFEDNYKNIGNPLNINNNIYNSSALSDISAFNNHNQSSIEMNMNINNNLERTAMKKRFLIPK